MQATNLELEVPAKSPGKAKPLVKNVVTCSLDKKDWEQKSLKMFYFKPNVANGKLVQIKGKQLLEKAWANSSLAAGGASVMS